MNHIRSNIVLIGFMGAGKTSVGRAVSEKMNYSFEDCDEIIKEKKSMSIEKIFSDYGEEYFRKLEYQTVLELSQLKKSIIATGGGVVLNKKNISNLKNSGIIIYLKASPLTIYRNITNDAKNHKDRPLLKNKNVYDRILALMKEREKMYNCYDYVIETDNLTIEETAEKILDIAQWSMTSEKLFNHFPEIPLYYYRAHL